MTATSKSLTIGSKGNLVAKDGKKISKPAAAKKPAGIRDQFNLRDGTNRAKLVDALLAAKGKPVAVSSLLKLLYGNTNEEGKAGLAMVLQGMKATISENKIKLEVIRDRDEKLGSTIALKGK